jgi:hypothetical protein
MKQIKLRPYQRLKLITGFRLALAGLILFVLRSVPMTAMIIAAIVLSMPLIFAKANFKVLAEGAGAASAEAAEKELLDKIEKRLKTAMDKIDSEGMTKEQKAAIDKAIEKLNKEIATLSNESMAELKKRVDKMAEDNEKLQKDLKDSNDALVKQSEAIKKLTEKGATEQGDKPISFKQALKEAIMGMPNRENILKERNDEYGKRLSFKDFFENNGKNATTPAITIKAAVDMFQSNIVGNYVNNIRLTDLDPSRVSIPLTIYPHVLNVFMVKPISKPYMSLLIVYTYVDGTATKTEGGAAAQSSFLLKTQEFKAFFVSTYFNLSDETLDDLDEVMAEIELVAPDKLMDKIDSYILGTAGDDASAIMGIRTATKSTAYATALPAASVQAAYIVDVIASAKLQAENNKLVPNVVYLSPTSYVALGAKKNNFNDSLSDKRVAYNTQGEATSVCGLAIIKSTEIPTDQILVLDNKQPWIGRRRDMTLEIGYNGTDFVEGQRTVILKTRVAFGVRNKLGVIWVSGVQAAIDELNSL